MLVLYFLKERTLGIIRELKAKGHIREFLTDHARGSDGFLVLKSQIILKGFSVFVEPLVS
jgi:hypothetical protein